MFQTAGSRSLHTTRLLELRRKASGDKALLASLRKVGLCTNAGPGQCTLLHGEFTSLLGAVSIDANHVFTS
jgi:hypothetical protein